MSKAVIEILHEVNENPEKLDQYKSSMLLRMTFEYAFDPRKKFVLPEGIPPYKADTCPLGTNPTNFNNEIRRLYIFTPQKELDKFRREALFIQLLETIHVSEAELLIAIKEQSFDVMFPNLTPAVLNQYGLLSDEILQLWTAEHYGKNHVIEINDESQTNSVSSEVKTTTEQPVAKKRRGRKPTIQEK